jgi:hypothetical protein
MDSIINARVTPEFPNTIVLALHGPGSVFWNYRGDSASKYFLERYEPSGFIDGLGFDVSYSHVRDSLASRYARSPEAPVKVEFLDKEWDALNRTVKLQIKATNVGNDLPGEYWFNVVVTEGNIKQQHRTQQGCAKPDVGGGLPFRENYFNHSCQENGILEERDLPDRSFLALKCRNQQICFCFY